jgi:hypothetical protein
VEELLINQDAGVIVMHEPFIYFHTKPRHLVVSYCTFTYGYQQGITCAGSKAETQHLVPKDMVVPFDP